MIVKQIGFVIICRLKDLKKGKKNHKFGVLLFQLRKIFVRPAIVAPKNENIQLKMCIRKEIKFPLIVKIKIRVIIISLLKKLLNIK